MSEPEVTLEDIRGLNEEIKDAVRASTTYFGATGKVHEELPWSNLLAFFFEPDKERLDSLVLDAFLYVAGVTDWCNKPKEDVQVEREVPIKGGRMDIVVSWASGKERFAIAIENKIWSRINNPLDLYKKYLEGHYHKNYRAFILSPNGTEASDNSGFTAITYPCLAKEIRKRLEALKGKKGKWEYMLEDFIDTIDTSLKPNKKIMELNNKLRGYLNDQISRLREGYDKSKEDFYVKRLNNEKKLFMQPSPWIYEEHSTLVFDFFIGSSCIAINIALNSQNCTWSLDYFRRDEDKGYSDTKELPCGFSKMLKNKGYEVFPSEIFPEGQSVWIPSGKIESGNETMESRREDLLNFLKKFLPDFEEAIEKSLGQKESV